MNLVYFSVEISAKSSNLQGGYSPNGAKSNHLRRFECFGAINLPSKSKLKERQTLKLVSSWFLKDFDVPLHKRCLRIDWDIQRPM